MKTKYLLILLMLISFFIFGCSNSNFIITIHYEDTTQTIKIKPNTNINSIEYNNSDYILAGWFNEDFSLEYKDIIITSNMDLYPKLIEKGTQFKIHYDLDGGKWSNNHPTKYFCGFEEELVDAIKDDYYAFDGWVLNNQKIDKISENLYGDLTLKATWKDVASYYKVNLNTNGGILENNSITIRQGSTLLLPIPTKDGYYFRGWYTDSAFTSRLSIHDNQITSDTTLYSNWALASNNNTYISFLGDSITTFNTSIPQGYVSYYPQGDVLNENDTWWYQVTNNLGYNLLVNDSYSGTLVTSGNNYGCSDERINNLSKDDIIPDVVIIHMGTNDFTHNTNINSFKESYSKMIEKIKYNYDDVKIYVCTLPYNTYDESFIPLRESVNEAIINIAYTYNLKVLDLTSVINKDNCRENIYAGSHPNKQGMKLMADFITNEILKETNN